MIPVDIVSDSSHAGHGSGVFALLDAGEISEFTVRYNMNVDPPVLEMMIPLSGWCSFECIHVNLNKIEMGKDDIGSRSFPFYSANEYYMGDDGCTEALNTFLDVALGRNKMHESFGTRTVVVHHSNEDAVIEWSFVVERVDDCTYDWSGCVKFVPR